MDGKLTFKTFVWPNNPHTYKEEYIREPKFVTEDKVTRFTGMGEMKRVITGSGAFFGPDALAQFQSLQALFEEETAGDLVHPQFGGRLCYFTALEITQEPRENHIPYTFAFTGATAEGKVPV